MSSVPSLCLLRDCFNRREKGVDSRSGNEENEKPPKVIRRASVPMHATNHQSASDNRSVKEEIILIESTCVSAAKKEMPPRYQLSVDSRHLDRTCRISLPEQPVKHASIPRPCHAIALRHRKRV